MNRGYIKIWRKIEDWEWIDDPNTLALLVHCTMMANWKDKKWHKEKIKRGAFVTSLSNLAAASGLTLQQTRTSLDKLIATHTVTKKTTNKYTIISINNYDEYQDTNMLDNKQITNKQQTNNKQITTTKEYKELKKDKKENIREKNILTSKEEYLENIPEEDMAEFLERFAAGRREIESKGEDLLNYCEANGKTYKNYKALLTNALKRDFTVKKAKNEKLDPLVEASLRRGGLL